MIQPTRAQVASETLKSISTPDRVETRIGTLDFKDGMPSKETIDKVYDNLDFTHGFEAFVNTMRGVSIHALRTGDDREKQPTTLRIKVGKKP
jgi:hypothetical protein